MASGVWDAILFLTKGLVDHMSLCLYLETCNMGGKPVTKWDELAGGTGQRGTPRCF